jgi:hypothetical protein
LAANAELDGGHLESKVCYDIEKIGIANAQVGTKVTGWFGLGSANI